MRADLAITQCMYNSLHIAAVVGAQKNQNDNDAEFRPHGTLVVESSNRREVRPVISRDVNFPKLMLAKKSASKLVIEYVDGIERVAAAALLSVGHMMQLTPPQRPVFL